MMERNQLIDALRRMQVETGSLVCLGCGQEHNCGIHGCAIIREAVEQLEMPEVILKMDLESFAKIANVALESSEKRLGGVNCEP